MGTTAYIKNLSPDEYHSNPAISKSGLSEFARSPAHYRYWLENSRPDTDALRIGQAFHTLILEPEYFDSRFLVYEYQPRNTKAGKASYEEALAEAGDRMLVRKQEETLLRDMAKAISEHVSARIILSGVGDVEPSLFWTHKDIGPDGEETDIACRGRADWIREDGLLVDLKTCNDARPHIFERDAFKYHYHWQAAMYCDAYEATTGKKPAGFAFVAVEKDAPHGVCSFVASEEFIELGRTQYRDALARFAECQQKNQWPKYEDALLPLALPGWVEKRLTFGEQVHV